MGAGWDFLTNLVTVVSRLPIERLLDRGPDNKALDKLEARLKEKGLLTVSAQRLDLPVKPLAQAASRELSEASSLESVSDESTLKYQLELLVDDLQHLETEHLPNKGRIEGKACDCIAKAARDLRRHATETIPIASRQGADPKIFAEIAQVANYLKEIGTADMVKSGRYDDEYLAQAGIISSYRKAVERMLTELKGGSTSGCEGCPTTESLREYLKHKRERVASQT